MADVDDIIFAICPRLTSSASVDLYKELALESISAEYFGTHVNYAIALMASHIFTMDTQRPNGDSGMITSKTEGRLSISYWNAINIRSNSDLHMTSYGKRYLSLIHKISPAVLSSSSFTGEGVDVI
jgi:hypothetical protein